MSRKATVDRVAQAMRSAYGRHIGDDIVPWTNAAKEPKAAWRACARAAIDELAER